MTNKKKLLILGDGRHGKDTVAEILRDKYGMTFKSSSEFACEKVVYPVLKSIKNYSSPEECFNDRHSDNNRDIWYQLITQYNTPDNARLAKELLQEYDIYVGMRNVNEVVACKEANLFDLCIYVDASERVKYKEPKSSNTIDQSHADVIFDNNGTPEDLIKQVDILWEGYINV